MLEYQTFSEENYQEICDYLAVKQPAFAEIIDKYGYPHYVTRPASFATLVRLIIEQQVSLASAKAAFDKLTAIAIAVTPEHILRLSDEDFRAATISRQKIGYLRILAEAISSNSLVLSALHTLSDDEARAHLMALKGIGNWTSDVFLMECLQRTDIFPVGDVALRSAMKACLELPKDTPPEALVAAAEALRPYRSIATMLFWHHYISTKNIDLKKLLS
ncbi:MAG: hypothetical protein RI894_1572 [Bacteroidota bacterium]|jgi:DNA-3-methyladenine glycosylase II